MDEADPAGPAPAARPRGVIANTILALEKVSRTITGALAAIAAVLVIAIICATVYEIFMRRVMTAPQIWVADISFMLNGAVFMLAAGWTLHLNGHVRIDVFSNHFPPRVYAGLQALFYLGAVTPVLLIGTRSAFDKAVRAFERGTVQTASAWEPLIWPFLAVITLGLAALVMATIACGLRRILDAFGAAPHGA